MVKMLEYRIPVLDGGYVELLDVMGDDLMVINRARASLGQRKTKLDDDDRRLLRYLAQGDPDHWMPFGHPKLAFEVCAPLMVVNQWYRTAIDSMHGTDAHAWSEQSRRYTRGELLFHIPDEWRAAPAHRKQGSGAPLPPSESLFWTGEMRGIVRAAEELYGRMVGEGVAPEQARLVLPAYALYTTFEWTASLYTVIRFLHERLTLGKNNAPQSEIMSYADVVRQFAEQLFPASMAAFFPSIDKEDSA